MTDQPISHFPWRVKRATILWSVKAGLRSEDLTYDIAYRWQPKSGQFTSTIAIVALENRPLLDGIGSTFVAR
jgi:hypothetical protein